MLVMTILTALGWAMPAASPGYPTPQSAGFHHCALIYDRPQRGQDDMAFYVARQHEGKAREWLFDAFLFLVYSSGRGIQTENGETRKEDWQYQLDRWFGPDRDLAALDASIETAARNLGAPPSRREIILSIPYTNPAVKDFGDVDGVGKGEDMSTPAGRETVLKWYLGEARRRFKAAGYRHLHLWGFYWMREDIPPDDVSLVSAAAEQVHAVGGRMLWIPWYRAPGWDRWREYGFDAALLQPNYAFAAWTHGGRVRRNRLNVTAALARERGLGVEVEAGALLTSATDQRNFLHYLADGAPSRLGYQQAATAYYLGEDMVEQTARSKIPAIRQFYETLADYVANRVVQDPDPPLRWTEQYRAATSLVRTIEARFSAPRAVAMLDVFLDEPDAASAWTGIVDVQIRRPGTKGWSSGGWTVRPGSDASSGRWQAVTVPVGATASALRVTFRSRPGSPPARVTSLVSDPIARDGFRAHRAVDRPYRFLPSPASQYGDNGAKLTDGVIPDTGFLSGQTVGWSGGAAAVCFDLGRVAPVSRIEVYCQGGSYAGVNWPVRSVLYLAANAQPPAAASGLGNLPEGFAWLPAGPVQIDRRRGPTDMDGHLVFTPPKPIPTRWATLLFDCNVWLMLSEIRILSEGRNVAPETRYALRPLPTAAPGEANRYSDDGSRLTDGVVARDYIPAEVTGWREDGPREIVVDMGSVQPVHTVTAWCLRGGKHGIFAPAEAAVEISADGSVWQTIGKASPAAGLEDGTICEAAAFRIKAPPQVRARLIRVRVVRRTGWTMLSEIEVD